MFAQAKSSSSKVYSSSGLEFVNCTENSTGTGVRVTDISKAATVKIKSGNAEGSTLTINVTGTVDRTGPKLLLLNVVSPDTGTYSAGQAIKITATFDESIYAKVGNTYESITSETAPELKVKFGDGTVRKATFSSAIGRRIIYSITIQNTDEGVLTATSYSGVVYDEKENSTNLSPKTLGGSKITATNLKKGDVNGDGNINIRDIILIRKYIANSTKWNLSNSQKLRAEVTGDGNINIRDIIKIRKYIAADSSDAIKRKHPDWMW